jgi:hypothetical protein
MAVPVAAAAPIVELEGKALTAALTAAKAEGAKTATAAAAKATAAKIAATKTAASGIATNAGGIHLGLGLGLGSLGPVLLVGGLCALAAGGMYVYMKRQAE